MLLPIYDPSVWGYITIGMSSFDSLPMVAISSPLTLIVYLLPFLSYLNNITLEAFLEWPNVLGLLAPLVSQTSWNDR